MERKTLEQKRAQHAWENAAGRGKEYVNLAKGLPSLIMNSGLMQVMAFLHEKGKKSSHHRELAQHLLEWLSLRFEKMRPDPNDLNDRKFENFMKNLIEADSRTYQDITAEAFAWLRWMRQMAPARQPRQQGD